MNERSRRIVIIVVVVAVVLACLCVCCGAAGFGLEMYSSYLLTATVQVETPPLDGTRPPLAPPGGNSPVATVTPAG